MGIIDDERLQILNGSQLLDSASEETFDRFTKLASLVLDTPVSLISLVDRDRQYFKSYHGLAEPWASRRQTSLFYSFCQHVVASRCPLIVKDAREEAFLKDNPAIPQLGMIAYLGLPLVVKDQVLGSFCVIDHQPRAWSEREIHIMQELSYFVATEIAFRIEAAERRKAEQQLRASEERFRTLANQAPIMIWQADINGRTTFHNATWSTFTGLTDQEGLGVGWSNAVHPDDRQKTLDRWKQARDQHLPYDTEFRLYRADGIYREVASHGSTYTDQNGVILGYIGTLMDISEQKELERQREAFLHMITHELKNPLTALRANIQLAQRRLKKLLSDMAELHGKQQAILSQAMNMLTRGMANLQDQTRLVDDLLDLSRCQVNKLELHLAPCDLVSLVQQSIQDKQMAQPERVITLTYPHNHPLIVFADAQRTRQVLSNYLNNACKYSPPEQPVEVGITPEKRVARVWVQDYGLGLTPEQQEHIWECFYQTHEIPAYATETPGLGLGLHICQMLVHGQKGEVGVESARGQGTTFWFTLPQFKPRKRSIWR